MKHVQKTGAKAGQWVTCTTTPEKCRNGGSHLRDGDLFLARRLYEEQTGEKLSRVADVPSSAAQAFLALPADKQQELREREWGKTDTSSTPKRPASAQLYIPHATLPSGVFVQMLEIAASHGVKMTRESDVTKVGLNRIHVAGLRLEGAHENLDAARAEIGTLLDKTEQHYADKTARLDESIAALTPKSKPEPEADVEEVSLPRRSFLQKRADRREAQRRVEEVNELFKQPLPSFLSSTPTDAQLEEITAKVARSRQTGSYSLPDGRSSAEPVADPYKDTIRVGINHVLHQSAPLTPNWWVTDAGAASRTIRPATTLMPAPARLANVRTLKVLEHVSGLVGNRPHETDTNRILRDLELLYTRGE